MRIYLLALFSFLFIQTTKCQKPIVKWSQEFILEKGNDFKNILTSDGNNYYLHTNKYAPDKQFGIVDPSIPTLVTPIITKLDKNLKVVKKNEFSKLTEKSELIGVEMIGDNFILITEKRNKAEKSREFYMALINKDLEVIKPNILLWSTPKAFNDADDAKLTYDFSSDHSMMIFNCVIPAKKKGESPEYIFMVINKDLEKLVQRKPKFSQISGSIIVLQNVVTNDGDVFIIGKVSKGVDVNNNTQYDLFSYKYGKDEKEIATKIEIPVEYYSINIYPNISEDNGNIYLFTTYTTIEENGIIGYMASKIDLGNNSIAYKQFNNFDLELIKRGNDLNDDKTKSKDPGLSYGLSLSYFKINPDNTINAVMEKSRNTYSQYGREYYAENLYVMNLDENGKQKWIDLIPKNQHSAGTSTYLNFYAKTISDKIYIFYNETKKNIDLSLTIPKPGKKFEDLDDFYQMMVEINSKGVMKKSVFLDPEKYPFGYHVKKYISTDTNQFLMIGTGYKTNSIFLGTTTFE